MKPKLTEQDILDGAEALNVTPREFKTILQVEAPKGGFLDDGQVTILYERHIFHKLTGGVYSAKYPLISNAKSGGYGAEGQNQHNRLAQAVALNRDAALKSTSWGKPQIMGFNYAAAGFETLQDFITAMHESEQRQIEAFISFLRKDKGGKMIPMLREHRWMDLAMAYNGAPEYAKRLQAAYRDLEE